MWSQCQWAGQAFEPECVWLAEHLLTLTSDGVPAIGITVTYAIYITTCAFMIHVTVLVHVFVCISMHVACIPLLSCRSTGKHVCACVGARSWGQMFSVFFCWDGLSLNLKPSVWAWLCGPGLLLLQPLALGLQGHCYPQPFHMDVRNPTSGPQTCTVSMLTTNLSLQPQLTTFKWLKICRPYYDLFGNQCAELQTSGALCCWWTSICLEDASLAEDIVKIPLIKQFLLLWCANPCFLEIEIPSCSYRGLKMGSQNREVRQKPPSLTQKLSLTEKP